VSVADTSALVALLDANHPHHADAARDLAEGHVTVTWGSLAEVATVVRRLAKGNGQDGGQAARQALAAITDLAGFRQAPPGELDAVMGLHGKETSLSFVDAWNLAAAVQGGEGLVSYDRDLRAAHRRHARVIA
jgi:predicted nucleic acid-binding protein